jgi:putative ABC transport system permease protein
MRLIADDPQLGPKVNVVSPTVMLTGIAGNFEIDASKTFLGTGYVPSDRERMQAWDQHGVNRRRERVESGLRDDDETRAVVGVGLARVLGLCEGLALSNRPPRPAVTTTGADGATAPEDIALLAQSEVGTTPAQAGARSKTRLDLLAATAGGAPNVLSVVVSRAEPQGARELDENFLAMHFRLAQRLLYGRGEHKAVGIVVQLHRTEDLPAVRARLASLFNEQHLDLEVRDFAELQPFYRQALGMFNAIFLFISLIMGIIVLFTVVNTMGMSVMERTSEIGTMRAMGLRRGGIRRLFLFEGGILGAVGATVGVAVASGIAFAFNRSGATWTPPSQAAPVPLEVMTDGVGGLLVGAWLGLVLMGTLAAAIPANRAARFKVVDALRHV